MARKSKSKSSLNIPIISSIGKPIPTKELLARLQKIADELSSLDQTGVSTNTYESLAADLAHPKLLNHKNGGIQAFTCCAIADILRLYAPDAPYNPEQLSAIFQAFFVQFDHLWNDENPYFLQQCYLLKRIVEVRSVVLITELPDASHLVTSMFNTMYTVASKGFPSKLESLVSDMLCETISECDNIPRDVVSLVIKRLTTASESDLLGETSNISNPSFAFSLAVCESNTDKMAREIAQYFSEILDDSVVFTGDRSKVDAPTKALEKIHTWSRQIWSHVPNLMKPIMGLINDELNSESEQIRVLATKTIGEMIASPSRNAHNSALIFVTNHNDTWVDWLKKSSDVSPTVRSKWVQQLSEVLLHETTTEINSDICSNLSKCLMDSSDRVRFAACTSIESLPIQTTLNKVCNKTNLNSLFLLIREKHSDIRKKAINILANIYDYYITSTTKREVVDFGIHNQDDIQELEVMISSDIPNNLLQLNYINDKSITTSVDIVLFEKIFRFEDDAEKRVSRLCHIYRSLNENSKAAFSAIVNRQKQTAHVIYKFLDLIEEYSSRSQPDPENKENHSNNTKSKDQYSAQLDKIIQWLSLSFPEGLHTYECFDLFFKLRNMRLVNLIKNCINSQSDYKTVKNSIKELLSKFNETKTIKPLDDTNPVSCADMVSNFKILLYRASSIIYNKSNIGELIKFSMSNESEYQSVSNYLIKTIATTTPAAFKNHVSILARMIESCSLTSVKISLLQSLYHIFKQFPEYFVDEPSFCAKLQQLAAKGSPDQAKYSIKIIGCSEQKELLASEIVQSILPLQINDQYFSTHLSTLTELYLVDPFLLSENSKSINFVVVEEVLKKNRLNDINFQSVDNLDWISEEQLCEHHILKEKILALRFVANKLRFVASNDTSDEATIAAAQKPLKLLANVISSNGEIVKIKPDLSCSKTPKPYKSRLRLAAGLMILKLAKFSCYSKFMSLDILQKLTRLLHDECEEVRTYFSESLKKYLSRKSIPEKFLHLIFFMGHEPNSTLKQGVKTWILSQHKKSEVRNETAFERISVRLIHSISHDERFVTLLQAKEEQSLNEIDAYIYASNYAALFIETIANERNISLLYYYASRVKQYRDILDPVDSLNLYRIAELFQLMLKELADSKGWSLETWPGKINLPADLFTPIDDFQQAQDAISRIYIADDVQVALRQSLKKTKSSSIPQKRKISSNEPLSKPSGSKKPKRVLNNKQKKKMKKEKAVSATTVARKSQRNAKRVFYGELEPSSDDKEDSSADEFDSSGSEV